MKGSAVISCSMTGREIKALWSSGCAVAFGRPAWHIGCWLLGRGCLCCGFSSTQAAPIRSAFSSPAGGYRCWATASMAAAAARQPCGAQRYPSLTRSMERCLPSSLPHLAAHGKCFAMKLQCFFKMPYVRIYEQPISAILFKCPICHNRSSFTALLSSGNIKFITLIA